MGAAGAARAHAGYGWDRIARATLEAYRAFGRFARARRTLRPVAVATPRQGRRSGSPALAALVGAQHGADHGGA